MVLKDKNILFSDVFSLHGVLGAGQYGIVLSVKPKQNSRYYQSNWSFYGQSSAMANEMSALKIIYKGKLHKEEIKIIRGEANILELLEGKQNIVQLKNFYET